MTTNEKLCALCDFFACFAVKSDSLTAKYAKKSQRAQRHFRFGRAARRSSVFGCALGRKLLSLFGDALLGPVVVAARLAGAYALGRLHLLHQVHVRREERDALADYLLDGLETLAGHEARQAFLQLVNDLDAVKHHARAELNGRSAEEHELDCVVRALDAADSTDGDLRGKRERELAHHAKRDGAHGLRGVAAGDCVALDRRERAQRV